jgi:hypothetical protein
MKPVKTARSNFVYRGPTAEIGDAWVERRPNEQVVYLTWQPTQQEREAIWEGANLKMGIFNMEPIPPVSLGISTDQVVDDADRFKISLSEEEISELKDNRPVGGGRYG